MSDLTALGWDDTRAEQFEPHADAGLTPGRVAVQHRGAYDVLTELGELRVDVAGRLYDGSTPADLPAVGDWVAVAARPDEQGGTIQAVLPRNTKFSRKTAWQAAEEQVLAANVDVVLIVTSINEDLNLRRLERYLTLAWESGARPCSSSPRPTSRTTSTPRSRRSSRSPSAFPSLRISNVPAPASTCSARTSRPGVTAALLGSSGVGKSTLVNTLARRGAARDARDSRRRQGAPHDDPPGARPASRWRPRDRHARDAGDPALGRRRGPRGGVRGRHRAVRTVPLLRLRRTSRSPGAPSRRRSRTGRCRRSAGRATSSCSGSSRTSSGASTSGPRRRSASGGRRSRCSPAKPGGRRAGARRTPSRGRTIAPWPPSARSWRGTSSGSRPRRPSWTPRAGCTSAASARSSSSTASASSGSSPSGTCSAPSRPTVSRGRCRSR